MVCRTEIANFITFDYCPDDLPLAADRLRAVICGRFVDELTGLGMTTQLRVTTAVAELKGRVAQSGIAGLVGNPARRFPGLAANAVVVDMTVNARRFVSQRFEESLGPINTGVGAPADFPHFFAPIDLGVVGLHRQTTVIRGRVVQNSATPRTPLGGVTVEAIGLWHQFPAANVDPLMVIETPTIASLRPGFYRSRPTAASQLQRRVMNAVVGEEKRLVLPTAVGSTQVRVSDCINLNPADIVALHIEHSDLVEYIPIAAIDGASDPAQPATLTLVHPLAHWHRVGTSVVRVLPQAPGAVNTFSRSAIAGDETVFLDGTADLGANLAVEVNGGAVAAEYHTARLYSTQSDLDGFYALPPLARVAQLQVRASRVDLPQPIEVIFSPDYDLAENKLDLIFP